MNRIQFPSGAQYREALQNPSFCFQDPDLRGGAPELDPLGLPRPISGNFASVFNIAARDGRRWAVKCFTRYAEDQERRYAAISRHLAQLSHPWRVSFQFLPNGVRIQGGHWYPVLKMEWIQATELIRFIEAHLWEPAVLAALAKRFAAMVDELAAAGIAHGDLQHGNILVAADGQLRLIDYDGMFVRGLESLGTNEKGHPHYQSPARSLQWGADLDRFSAWVIYLSLVALTLDPTLWRRLRADGDECLLFRSDDYLAPASSQALLAFQTSANDQLRALASVVERLWSADLQELPPLRPQDAPAPATTPTMAGAAAGTGAAAATGLPSWVAAGAVSTMPPVELPAEPIPPNPGGWLSGHLSPLPRVRFAAPAASARLAVALVLLGLAAVIAGSVAGALPAVAAPVSATVGVGLFLLIEASLYQRTPERQARFERRAAFGQRRGDLKLAQGKLDKLVQDRRRLDTSERRDCGRVTKRQDEAGRAEQSELGKVTAGLSRRMGDITSRQRSLQATEHRERGNALRLLQDQHVQARLAAQRVGSRKLAGIGDSLIWNLSRHGIHTAADFTGVSVSRSSSGSYTREVAYIHLRSGRAVHVEGIGPKKARTLDGWRRSVESQARASQPTQLPAAQDCVIVQKYTSQRQSLANEEQAARSEAGRRSTEVRHKWQTTQARLLGELQAIRQQAAQSRVVLDRQIVEARRVAGAADWRLALARRELDAYAEVRYRHYLKRILSG